MNPVQNTQLDFIADTDAGPRLRALPAPTSDFRPPASPIAERDAALAILEHAGRVFMERACAETLSILRERGPLTGEQITDAVKAAGIVPPAGTSDKVFGPVYMRLARAGKIRKCGFAVRKKGHGTSGGNVWEAVEA